MVAWNVRFINNARRDCPDCTVGELPADEITAEKKPCENGTEISIYLGCDLKFEIIAGFRR
jgi:hypothetical protein